MAMTDALPRLCERGTSCIRGTSVVRLLHRRQCLFSSLPVHLCTAVSMHDILCALPLSRYTQAHGTAHKLCSKTGLLRHRATTTG